MFCHNCGHELENGAKFCNNCGTPQQTQNTPESQPVAQEPVATPVAQPQQETQSAVPYAEQAKPQQETQSAVPYAEQAQPQQTAPQYNSSVPYNANLNPQPPVKPKKSSTGCIVAIIVAVVLGVLLVAGIITVAIIGFNTAKDITDDTDISISDSFDVSADDIIDDENDTPNPEYLEIFTNNNIIDSPTLFIDLDSRTFALEDEDGVVEKMEFAYDGDVIKELVDTIYYPIGDYSKDVVETIDESMKESFADADALECCTIKYQITDDYYITTIHSTQLNNVANLASLSAEDVLSYDGFAAYLSMEQTADNLISQGYVEK